MDSEALIFGGPTPSHSLNIEDVRITVCVPNSNTTNHDNNMVATSVGTTKLLALPY